ncbi:MAG TPA: D-aminoacyl-tRNA deacylase [Spirochaetales bacterium]|nr:D-aminoacyl-tRNA deacylase [Spirochaetales bacterium]
MKVVVQRVRDASVRVDGTVSGAIQSGLLVYLGVAKGDSEQDAAWLAEKIMGLRIFEDENGKMNLSVQDCGGGILVVSQFTLLADARKGRRPSYNDAASPQRAENLYEYFMRHMCALGIQVQSGVFGAHMDVAYINDGPVTILLQSPQEEDTTQ